MKVIEDFEKRLWELMATAAEGKDLDKIQQLNAIMAQDLDKVKKDAQKVQNAIDKLEARLESLGASPAGRSTRKPPLVRSPAKSRSVTAYAEDPIDTAIEESVVDISEELYIDTSGGSVSWEVTDAELARNILSTTQAKKAGLIPNDGSLFVVETSVGQVFKTSEISSQDRLKEKKKIREFYDGAGINPGDKVVWTEIRPNTYRLEKAPY